MPKTKSGPACASASVFTAALCLAAGMLPALAQETGTLRGLLPDEAIAGTSPVSGEHTGSVSGGASPYRTIGSPAPVDDAVQTGALADTTPPNGDAAPSGAMVDAESGSLATGALPAPPPAEGGDAVQRTNRRVRPVEGKGDTREEDDPFAPLGLRVGTFTVFPTLEQGLEWSSNADEVPGGGSGLLSSTTLRLSATSDWARHSATIEAYGTYRKTISGADVSDLEGGLRAGLQLDFSRELKGLARIGYTIRPESASSPVVITNVEKRPLLQTIEGSLGLAKEAGKLRLAINGAVARDQFGNARLAGGGTLSQSDRNTTLATLSLRGGYALSPATTPFVEGEVGRRFYDETHDSSGYARSATRLGARAGVALDMGEKLSGEASLGWIVESPDDARLEAISGPSAAVNLAWSPVRGTVVKLDGATTVETTTTPGESGSLLHSGQVSVEREIRADLKSSLLLGADWRSYVAGGHDLVLFGEAELTWWLNRNLGVTGRVRHEKLDSSLAGRDYEASSVFLGMKLQR